MFIAEVLFGERAVLLLDAVDKQQPVVDDSLPAENVVKIFIADIYIGEYVKVGLPAYDRAPFSKRSE